MIILNLWKKKKTVPNHQPARVGRLDPAVHHFAQPHLLEGRSDLGGLFMRHVAEHDAQFLRSGSGSGDIWWWFQSHIGRTYIIHTHTHVYYHFTRLYHHWIEDSVDDCGIFTSGDPRGHWQQPCCRIDGAAVTARSSSRAQRDAAGRCDTWSVPKHVDTIGRLPGRKRPLRIDQTQIIWTWVCIRFYESRESS